MPGRKIWITRAQPGADATASRVKALGHEALVAPLLSVQPVAGAEVDLTDIGALAFTSANGVRAFAELSPARDLKIFAVGAATAAAAKAVGFRKVLSADGDVEALAEGIVGRQREIHGVVLHPGAAEPAGDLVGLLKDQGVEARSLVLYDTAPVSFTAEQRAGLDGVEVALLHSPKAAEALVELLKTHPMPDLKVLGLSQAVMRPLARAKIAHKAFAPFPLEAALLNLIDRTPD
ncbi:uroporphyrinogen-III synthase [Phenylobacterium aquaticum]|uniref:uroporphyrinogen-III synthase n=1 Tax=Phenylobacterium aquaticum TaxID=1763816 RepID=UPI0026F06DA5|nr:uroporphyrinogen-III synthase [Phenylobacterium aquaticum]